ncbi:MAG: kelch repeat-containing protein [Chloroflexota bacterium]
MHLPTVTLVVQILFFLVLCAGVAVQLMANRGNQDLYKWHDRLQAPVVVLNILFIIFVMMPTFGAVIPGSLPPADVPMWVTLLHGILGTIAQGLAIYCLLAGFKILPRKIGTLRYYMWAAFIAWSLALLFGIGVYFVFHAGSGSGGAPTAEHDADLGTTEGGDVEVAPAAGEEPVAEHDEAAVEEADTGDEGTETTEEPVAEHDEAAVEEAVTEEVAPEATEEMMAEHDEAAVEEDVAAEEEATEEVVSEHDEAAVEEAEPTEEAAPEEETVSEHDEAAVEPTDAGDDTTATDEGADEMDAMIDEHAEEGSVVEPEFTGETGVVFWAEVQPSGDVPSPRYEHAMTYSEATNKVYLFGGRDGSQIFNDVWTYDVASGVWQQLAVNSPTAPPARFSTVLTIDGPAQNLYIATGHTQGGKNFNDVWKLDLATETWQDLTATAGAPPTERYGSPGGSINGNLITTHGFGSTRYDDTWQFNISTGQWENITPAGALPLKRCLFAAAPSSERYLVIHGGCASPFGDCFLDDAWVLDTQANSWTEVLSDVKPVGRQYQTLVDITGRERQIMFGGQDASRAPRDDVWFLNLDTGQWQLVVSESEAKPSARYNHAAVWIPGNAAMFVFGGRDSSGALGDMWSGGF